MAGDTAFMETLTALCKRRGFIYQSSEIYGGIGGFWDYGPLGVELKRNIKNQWWHDMVTNAPAGPNGHEIEMVGVDCSLIMNPKVWEASGHVGGFSDPMVDCRACKKRFRADTILFVTVMPAGSVRDRERAMLGQAPLDIAAGESRMTCVGIELGFGGVEQQARDAIQAYARVNNIGLLKKFVPGESGERGQYVYFAGRDGGSKTEEDDCLTA